MIVATGLQCYLKMPQPSLAKSHVEKTISLRHKQQINQREAEVISIKSINLHNFGVGPFD
jgi:hypothetical protein